jgi:hypothetical protein
MLPADTSVDNVQVRRLTPSAQVGAVLITVNATMRRANITRQISSDAPTGSMLDSAGGSTCDSYPQLVSFSSIFTSIDLPSFSIAPSFRSRIASRPIAPALAEPIDVIAEQISLLQQTLWNLTQLQYRPLLSQVKTAGSDRNDI